jgi:ribonuclease HII
MPRAREPQELRCTRRLESEALRRGWRLIAGTDEAGRGALLGPLYAAAVILNPASRFVGINDSKKLTVAQRLELDAEIRTKAIAYKVVSVCAADVDRWNVYEASRRAMIQALLDLAPKPDFILTDAMPLSRPDAVSRYNREFSIPYRAIIHGDARSVSIAAASILAKVARDARLEELDQQFPNYHLARNKGYGTAEHLEALRRFGPCPEHRKTYQPVKGHLLPLFPAEFD